MRVYDPASPLVKPLGGKAAPLPGGVLPLPHRGQPRAAALEQRARAADGRRSTIRRSSRGRGTGYKRPDKIYPVSWIRTYGKGRVFYTSIGHMPETFMTPVARRPHPGGRAVRAGRPGRRCDAESAGRGQRVVPLDGTRATPIAAAAARGVDCAAVARYRVEGGTARWRRRQIIMRKGALETPSVQSVDRVLTILEAVAKSAQPVPLAQLTDLLGINQSSVFRLANTLKRRGFLANPNTRKSYVLGPAIWRMSRNYDWSGMLDQHLPRAPQGARPQDRRDRPSRRCARDARRCSSITTPRPSRSSCRRRPAR